MSTKIEWTDVVMNTPTERRCVMNMPSPMTFDTWKRLHPEMDVLEDDCKECGGKGWVECFHCGGEMDCEECKGTGKIKGGRSEYEKQLEKDKQAWERMNAALPEW